MLIDTHCHLYSDAFKDDLAEVIKRAVDIGVERFYLPAIEARDIEKMQRLKNEYPNHVYLMAGVHPCAIGADYETQVGLSLQQPSVVAIGEIGLDFYRTIEFEKEQRAAFIMQMEFALAHRLPVVIHSRNATSETIKLIKPFAAKGLNGIFHCFGGSVEEAKAIIDLGFYLGIGGVVTFKNAALAKVLASVDMQWMVLETDAPYLAPTPFRGQRNEPSYLIYVAHQLAAIKNSTLAEIQQITTQNALRIFGG